MKTSNVAKPVRGAWLLFSARYTEYKLTHQELGLVAVEGIEFRACRAKLFVPAVANDEKIAAAGLGGEVCGSGFRTGSQTDKGLPTRAETGVTRIAGAG